MEADEQGTHFYLMTLAKPSSRGGLSLVTAHGTATVGTGTTRMEAYRWVYNLATKDRPDLADAVVLAFEFGPNTV